MILALLLTTMTAGAQYSYTLTLDYNYEGGASQTISNIESGSTIDLSNASLIPTRIGSHTFYGWSTTQYGSAQYATGSDHQTNKTITLTDNLTLYAIWDDTPISRYYITLDLNYEGAAPSSPIPVSYPFVHIPTSPTRVGHTFYGWSVLPNGSVVYPPGCVIDLSGNLTLYAIWDDTTIESFPLIYDITSESPRTVKVSSYTSEPIGTLIIPSTVTIDSKDYAVTSIGEEAFQFCTGLTSVIIPASVTSIGEEAFLNCHDLASVVFSDGLISIGDNAFNSCTNLTSVTIPASVTSIGICSFAYCGLTSINVNASNPNYSSDNGILFNKDKTTLIIYPQGKNATSYSIPSTVTSIADVAFMGCNGLTSVTIPASVTSIGVNTFDDCDGLTSINIPASVTSIGDWAFEFCANLASVTVYATAVPTLGIDVFDYNKSGRKIYVFDNLKNTYKSAESWSEYASAIESIDDVTVSGVTANQNPDKTTDNWCTYYHPLANVKINTENVKIFKASLSGSSLTLTEVSGNVIEAGQAVVLKVPASGALNMELTSSVATGDFSGNELKGTTEALSGAAGNIYVLNYTPTNGMGFYKLSAAGSLGANKAYLTYDGALSNFFGMDEETTGLKSIDNGQWIMDNYYDLSGRKVENPKKGIYIHNGKKVAIK